MIDTLRRQIDGLAEYVTRRPRVEPRPLSARFDLAQFEERLVPAVAPGTLLAAFFDGTYGMTNPSGPDSATAGVSTFDPASKAEAALFSRPNAGGGRPEAVAAVGTQVFVAFSQPGAVGGVPGNPYGTDDASTISVIDTNTGVATPFAVRGRETLALAPSADGKQLLVAFYDGTYTAANPYGAASATSGVSLFNPATGAETPLFSQPVVVRAAASEREPAKPTALAVSGTQVFLALSQPGNPYSVSSPALDDSSTILTIDSVSKASAVFSTRPRETLALAVTPPAGVPVAAADAFATPAGIALSVPARGVLANDTTPNAGGTLTAALVAAPAAAQGQLALLPDGSFTFTPAAGFSGPATFTYAASDGAATSAPATVTVTVGVPAPLALTLTNSSPTTDNTPTLTGTVNGPNATDITLTITGLGVPLPPLTAVANAGAYSLTLPTPLPDGTYTVTAVGTDRVTRAVSPPVTLTVVINTATSTFAVGGGAGGGPRVRTFTEAGVPRLDFFAFETTFLGGVRVAQGDFNRDGTDDIVAATGPGSGPRVKVFDGKTGAELASFLAYEPTFTNGVFVAVGDVTGDGVPDVVTGTSSGGAARVRVFDGANKFAPVGGDAGDFFVYDPGFRGGVRVAVGDINNDKLADIVTGAGVSGGPHVQGYSLKGGTRTQVANFFAYDTSFRGGIFVAVTAAGQIVTGPDGVPNSAGTIVSQLFAGLPDTAGGLSNRPSTDADLTTAPEARVFDSRGIQVASARPFADTFANGVRVGTGVAGDGGVLLYAAAGEMGGSRVRVYRVTPAGLTRVGADVMAFEDAFLGSVYVGGTNRPLRG